MRRLLDSRRAAKRETTAQGPSLHIIVPTLQCGHTCQYCQVSRSISGSGFTLSMNDLNAACDTALQSTAPQLTIEFQGGDPLIRFDMVRHAIDRIRTSSVFSRKHVRFVVCSTLHQLTEEMCEFFRHTGTILSTSIDGPRELHNQNRPLPTRDSYERTVRGIQIARKLIGTDSVSALMTTTRASLSQPEAIVDEYVSLGFHEIFIRPLSQYGFAKNPRARFQYSLDEFFQFYQRCLDRILYWNSEGYPLREAYASILLNKILSTFDGGYIDLQSPSGAGLGCLVYNYDGYVYPSDESRMLAETGDLSLRLGKIGNSIPDLLESDAQKALIRSSLPESSAACSSCAYNVYCGHNPVDAQARFGSPDGPTEETDHCRRHKLLFDEIFFRLKKADSNFLGLAYCWARPGVTENPT